MEKPENWSLLINSPNSIESGIMISILEEEGIPVLKKSRGSGAYLDIYMGISNTGFDLYVPTSQLDKARQLIIKTGTDSELLNQVIEPVDIPEGIKRKRIFGKTIIGIFFLVPLILGFIYFVITTFINILKLE